MIRNGTHNTHLGRHRSARSAQFTPRGPNGVPTRLGISGDWSEGGRLDVLDTAISEPDSNPAPIGMTADNVLSVQVLGNGKANQRGSRADGESTSSINMSVSAAAAAVSGGDIRVGVHAGPCRLNTGGLGPKATPPNVITDSRGTLRTTQHTTHRDLSRTNSITSLCRTMNLPAVQNTVAAEK